MPCEVVVADDAEDLVVECHIDDAVAYTIAGHRGGVINGIVIRPIEQF